MRWLRAVWFHLRALARPRQIDDEIDFELRDHLERATRANVARGMSQVEARRAALAAFGSVQRYREEMRELRAARWLGDAASDLGYAVRLLRRSPGFAVVAVLTLALGVGANSAVFTVVRGVLLRPLPFHEPDRLFVLSHLPSELPFQVPPGLPDNVFLSYRARQHAFEPLVAYQRAQYTLTGAGDATRVTGAQVGADFFRLLGVAPARGRGFTAGEEQPGGGGVAVIGHRLWRERFGADPGVVGRTIALDGTPRTIVGVAPPGFGFPASAEVWTPLIVQLQTGNTFILSVLGRLAEGVTPERARNELAAIANATDDAHDPHAEVRSSVSSVVPLKEQVTAGAERSLLVFAGAVAFVLLIAGVNLANLLLIRAATRRREVALRVALGASRKRLLRQFLAESAVIATGGGLLGIGIAAAGTGALLAIAPAGILPRLDEVHVDGWVLAFTLAVAAATGLLFGLHPALVSARHEPQPAIAQGGRTASASLGGTRGRFVMAEIALAFVLLTGAGLMIRSFAQMRATELGFDADGVITMTVDLPMTAYPDAERARAFHEAVLERLASIPGVRAVGAVSFRPMTGMGIMGDIKVEGQTPVPDGFTVDKPTVSPGYFSAMGIRLLRGRDFTRADAPDAPGVVIVSEAVVRALWPGQDAIGGRISVAEKPGPADWLTVVGVAANVVQDRELKPRATIYLPYLQTTPIFFVNHMTYVVRTAVPPASVAPQMRGALRDVDPTVPAQELQTMDASMLQLVREALFQTRLLTTLSILALLLAAIGTFGVLAYDVAERTREIGIRMTLGAGSQRVLRMVARRTLALAGAGTAIGAGGALLATRVLSRFLYEVSPTDPWTFAATAVVLVVVALMAGLIPARKASRLDPVVALRAE